MCYLTYCMLCAKSTHSTQKHCAIEIGSPFRGWKGWHVWLGSGIPKMAQTVRHKLTLHTTTWHVEHTYMLQYVECLHILYLIQVQIARWSSTQWYIEYTAHNRMMQSHIHTPPRAASLHIGVSHAQETTLLQQPHPVFTCLWFQPFWKKMCCFNQQKLSIAVFQSNESKSNQPPHMCRWPVNCSPHVL